MPTWLVSGDADAPTSSRREPRKRETSKDEGICKDQDPPESACLKCDRKNERHEMYEEGSDRECSRHVATPEMLASAAQIPLEFGLDCRPVVL
jgi:hypothetical protein